MTSVNILPCIKDSLTTYYASFGDLSGTVATPILLFSVFTDRQD